MIRGLQSWCSAGTKALQPLQGLSGRKRVSQSSGEKTTGHAWTSSPRLPASRHVFVEQKVGTLVVYGTVKFHELDDWDPHLPSCPPHNPLFPTKQLTDILSTPGVRERENCRRR